MSQYTKEQWKAYKASPERKAKQKHWARAWKERNREKVRLARRLWKKLNRERLRERDNARRAISRKLHPEVQRARRKRQAPSRKAAAHRRNARLRGARETTLTAAQWLAIRVAYRHRCAYCGTKVSKLTLDHVLPLAHGGQHVASNVVPACLPCNLHKGQKILTVPPSKRLLM